MSKEERELPIRSAADKRAFKHELTTVVPHLRAFARGLCGRPDMADDLVQETLLKAWAAQDRSEPARRCAPDVRICACLSTICVATGSRRYDGPPPRDPDHPGQAQPITSPHHPRATCRRIAVSFCWSAPAASRTRGRADRGAPRHDQEPGPARAALSSRWEGNIPDRAISIPRPPAITRSSTTSR